MASLIKSSKLKTNILKNNAILFTAIRNHWNKDYKPGPYPLTEEERLKAAEKYNLHPSEYEPYPDDGTGFGDYPKLPYISGEAKDPFYPWDKPELRQNFNEPMHAEFALLREDRYDVTTRKRKPIWRLILEFLACFGGLGTLYCLGQYVKMFHPLVPRQYPKDGKKYYTFEQN